MATPTTPLHLPIDINVIYELLRGYCVRERESHVFISLSRQRGGSSSMTLIKEMVQFYCSVGLKSVFPTALFEI